MMARNDRQAVAEAFDQRARKTLVPDTGHDEIAGGAHPGIDRLAWKPAQQIELRMRRHLMLIRAGSDHIDRDARQLFDRRKQGVYAFFGSEPADVETTAPRRVRGHPDVDEIGLHDDARGG